MSARFAALCFISLCVTGTLVYSQGGAATSKTAPAQAKTGAVAPPATDAEKIASAKSAAPASIAAGATIMDIGKDMKMRTLKAGTNGWTCIPDSPSPGVDPMCVDQNGMLWMDAWMNHKDPPAGKMALGYMLMGGSDASQMDPFATGPKPGEKWVDTGPHIMVLNIGTAFAGYPTVATNTKAPYVMFPNTPYAHLMVPVSK